MTANFASAAEELNAQSEMLLDVVGELTTLVNGKIKTFASSVQTQRVSSPAGVPTAEFALPG